MDSSEAQAFLQSSRGRTHEAQRLSSLRCEVEEDPARADLVDTLTHTPSAKELEVFLPLMGLGCCSDRKKEVVATRQYKPVPVKADMVNKAVRVPWDSRDDRERMLNTSDVETWYVVRMQHCSCCICGEDDVYSHG